jgi:hypothetical protein
LRARQCGIEAASDNHAQIGGDAGACVAAQRPMWLRSERLRVES